MNTQEKQFYKILDAKLAQALAESGFSYITENTTEGQLVYVFDKSAAIDSFLSKLQEFGETTSPECITDSVLVF